jgi:subtilisin family serine protease
MEKEYTVIANTREDLPVLEAEITASSGTGPIPNRSVDIANPRPGSKIQTHFMLTDEEAEELRKDPRVRAVEIPPDQRDDISIGLNAYQRSNFFREGSTGTAVLTDDQANWGLRRCIETTNVYGSNTTVDGPYQYALDGRGVDVVIQDSGIQAGHPEWEDANGVSRLQQIDWYTASGLPGTQDANFYTDYDGHGSHCAGITAGKLFGWAKGAHIYAQKLGGLEGPLDPGSGIPVADAFDCIRLWHNAKTNGRPTVVNMSWGYGATITGDPTNGVYRGTAWTWGVDYSDRADLEAATGVSPYKYINGGTLYFRMPVRVASVDAEVEDMIDDGIHVCIAAGNQGHKIDVVGGLDYDNTVTFNGSTRNYHRGGSPYSDRAFMVGSIATYWVGYEIIVYPIGTEQLDRTSTFSERGPGVNIWAPGDSVQSVCSNINDGYTTIDYPGSNGAYKMMSIGGTSMASPQIAGMVACHLQSVPGMTPEQMQNRMWADSRPVIYSSGSSTDYERRLDSLMGSNNRMAYFRYGKQPVTTNSVDAIRNISTS